MLARQPRRGSFQRAPAFRRVLLSERARRKFARSTVRYRQLRLLADGGSAAATYSRFRFLLFRRASSRRPRFRARGAVWKGRTSARSRAPSVCYVRPCRFSSRLELPVGRPAGVFALSLAHVLLSNRRGLSPPFGNTSTKLSPAASALPPISRLAGRALLSGPRSLSISARLARRSAGERATAVRPTGRRGE